MSTSGCDPTPLYPTSLPKTPKMKKKNLYSWVVLKEFGILKEEGITSKCGLLARTHGGEKL